jgi:hypothetical protein
VAHDLTGDLAGPVARRQAEREMRRISVLAGGIPDDDQE